MWRSRPRAITSQPVVRSPTSPPCTWRWRSWGGTRPDVPLPRSWRESVVGGAAIPGGRCSTCSCFFYLLGFALNRIWLFALILQHRYPGGRDAIVVSRTSSGTCARQSNPATAPRCGGQTSFRRSEVGEPDAAAGDARRGGGGAAHGVCGRPGWPRLRPIPPAPRPHAPIFFFFFFWICPYHL